MTSLKRAGQAYIRSKAKKPKTAGEVVLDLFDPSLLKAGRKLRAYRRGKGYAIKPASGPTSRKDPTAVMLNRLLELNEGATDLRDIIIPKHVYSKTSRVIRSLDDFLAIKTLTGEKGWIDESGGFFSEDALVRQILRGLDSTSYGASADLSLEAMYLAMSPLKRAQFAKKASAIDWDQFFKELYPANGRIPPLSEQKKKIYGVALEMGIDLGWYSKTPRQTQFRL